MAVCRHAGSKADGAGFVPEAVAKGAAAILVEDGTRSPCREV